MSAKTAWRDAVAGALFRAGLTRPARRARGFLSIVTFHRVLPETERRDYPYPGLVVTPSELDAFLAYFTAHFDCGPLAGQHQRWQRGEAAAHPLLALTFDDAQADNFRHARPVLARHGALATFFAPVQAVEEQELLWHDRLGFAVAALLARPAGAEELSRLLAGAGLPARRGGVSLPDAVEAAKTLSAAARLRLVEALAQASGERTAPEFARMMTFDELAALAADGHEIGSHSMTHRLMPECDDDALRHELEESKRVLQARLGAPIESFCYPNGDSDQRCAAAVAAAGYRRAVTTTWGRNAPAADRFRLRRCDMDARRTRGADGNPLPAVIAFRMSGFYPGLT